jgi:hypothetical protein
MYMFRVGASAHFAAGLITTPGRWSTLMSVTVVTPSNVFLTMCLITLPASTSHGFNSVTLGNPPHRRTPEHSARGDARSEKIYHQPDVNHQPHVNHQPINRALGCR